MISTAAAFRSTNNKRDLILSIREYTQNKWQTKELNALSKKQLYCIFAREQYKYNNKKRGE